MRPSTTRKAGPLQAALCPNQFQMVAGEPGATHVARVISVLYDALNALTIGQPACRDGDTAVEDLRLVVRLGPPWRLAPGSPGRCCCEAGGRAALGPPQAGCRLQAVLGASGPPGRFLDSVAHLQETLSEYGA